MPNGILECARANGSLTTLLDESKVEGKMTEITSNRLRLLKHWQERLTACEAAASDEASTFGWLWRVKARIYRFLLSRYAEGDWRSDSGENAFESEEQASRQPLVVREPLPEMASEPKSGERIHATLDKVHESAPAVAKGDYQYERPAEEYWYPAGRVHREEHGLRRSIQRLLEREGIAYRWEKTPVSFFLRVHEEHQERVRELLEGKRQEMRQGKNTWMALNPGAVALIFLLILAECLWIGIVSNYFAYDWQMIVLLLAGVLVGVLAASGIAWWTRRTS